MKVYNEDIDVLLKELLKSNELPPPALVQHVKCAAENVTQRPYKRGRNRLFRTFALAALCLIISISAVAAFGANIFGVRDLLLPNPGPMGTIEQPDGTAEEFTMDFISLQGFAGSPEHAAAVAWQNFLHNIDGSNTLIISGDIDLDRLPEKFSEYEIIFENDLPEIPEEYAFYGVLLPGQREKLHEILETYELRILGALTQYDDLETFHASVADGPFLDDRITAYPGYRFESGTFQFDGQYGDIWFQFRSSRKGVFDTVFLMIDDVQNFTERNFENVHSTELTLMQSTNASLIILETETAFIVVSIGRINQSELEQFANLIDFRQLK